jgi:hypothetical protein
MLEAHGNQQSGSTGARGHCPDCYWIKSPMLGVQANQSVNAMSWADRLRVAVSDPVVSSRLKSEPLLISSLMGRSCDDFR